MDFNDVMRFFCHNRGCLHLRAQYFMARNMLDIPTDNTLPACGNRCIVCRNEWEETFLPVYRSSVIAFFDSEHGTRRGLSRKVDKKTSISNVLWKNV